MLMRKLLREALERRDLIANLVARELKIRYRGSALGFLWSLLIPLFMALIYLIFLRLLGGASVSIADIIIGVFAWQFTVNCINSGLSSVTGSTNLVKKIYFPRFILPLSATIANLINYLLSLIVQIPFVAILQYCRHETMSPLILAMPVIILLQFVFNLSLAFLLAAGNVYYRDTQHFVGVALSAWFFVSPVMYNMSLVEKVAQGARAGLLDIFMLNPLAVIITAYRCVSASGEWFPWSPGVLACIAIIGLLFILSLRVFQRLQRDFADLL